MKKFLIPVLSIMLLLPFMYGGCLDSATDEITSQIPTVPSLAGTWGGPGEVNEDFLPLSAGQRLEAGRTQFEACADTLPWVEVVVLTDETGNITDATLCGESLSAWQGTIDGDVTGGGVADNYITYSFTTTTSEGSAAFRGYLVFDYTTSGDVYGFLDLEIFDGDGEVWANFAHALLQLGSGSVPVYTESGLYGSWSGFAIDFSGTGITVIDRTDPINLTFTEATSFDVSGSFEDATITSGFGDAYEGTAGDFGAFTASFEVDDGADSGQMDGLQSPDLQVIGGFTQVKSQGAGWSVFMLHKQ